MPKITKTVTTVVCTTCGRASCDGGRWEILSLTEVSYVRSGKSFTSTVTDRLPQNGNRVHCTRQLNRGRLLKGFKVGEEANWQTKIGSYDTLTYLARKIED